MTRARVGRTIDGEKYSMGSLSENDPCLRLPVFFPFASNLCWIITHSDANEPLKDYVYLDTVNLEDATIISEKVIASGGNDTDTRKGPNKEEVEIEVSH